MTLDNPSIYVLTLLSSTTLIKEIGIQNIYSRSHLVSQNSIQSYEDIKTVFNDDLNRATICSKLEKTRDIGTIWAHKKQDVVKQYRTNHYTTQHNTEH